MIYSIRNSWISGYIKYNTFYVEHKNIKASAHPFICGNTFHLDICDREWYFNMVEVKIYFERLRKSISQLYNLSMGS